MLLKLPPKLKLPALQVHNFHRIYGEGGVFNFSESVILDTFQGLINHQCLRVGRVQVVRTGFSNEGFFKDNLFWKETKGTCRIYCLGMIVERKRRLGEKKMVKFQEWLLVKIVLSYYLFFYSNLIFP